jgi:lysophospholipase L1-like esterase
MRPLSLAFVALAALWVVPVQAADPPKKSDFFFKDGDTVVMIGDSITEQHLYSNYVEMWTVTRFPEWKLTFRNTGIGGDTSGGGNGRFKRDVLRYNPTAMTVDFGMNDGGYGGFNEGRFKPYYNGLQGMAEQAKAAKIRVAWVTPQPLDTDAPGKTEPNPYNPTLEQFSEKGVQEIAKKYDGLFVDQYHPYLAVLNKARGEMDKYQRITAGDAVHPGPAGQSLMAASILKGLSFPKLIISVEVDAEKGRVTSKSGCTVPSIGTNDGVQGVRWEQLDDAVPFFPPEASGILKWSPILEDLNDYHLKVTGLKDGKYEVRLSAQKIAEYSAAELAKGVNLAPAVLKMVGEKEQNPVLKQALAIKTAIEKKNQYHHDQIFRGVVLYDVPGWLKLSPQEIEEKKEAAVKERLEKLKDFDAVVRKACEMKAHTVEIVPVK